MAITPIMFNATVQRTQDFTTMKQNEDNKGAVDQSNFQMKMEKEFKLQLSNVRTADNAEKKGDNSDAKEKGNGSYAGDGGRRRPGQKEINQKDKVLKKDGGHFDMSI
ncbi:MAG: hypothetical protein NC412_02015 [Roseburia sp.]|nr:hypothetical protein [Roseburia sp.]MCM1278016.1 hypothetical protein [Robinsoniella sp.]